MDNPFATLGIAPGVLKGLSDEEIAGLVRAMYRALSLIHHPDKGGRAQDFQKISAAAEQLDREHSPHTFIDWKEQYLRPRKDQARAIAAQAQTEAAQRRAAEDRLCTFWEAFAGVVPTHDEKITGRLFSVFALPPTLFLVGDVARRALREKERIRDAQSRTERLLRAYTIALEDEDDIDSLALMVDAKGRLTRTILEKTALYTKSHDRVVVPSGIPDAWVQDRERKHLAYFWKPKGKPEELRDVRIVGSIDREALKRVAPQMSQFVGLLPGALGQSDYRNVAEGFTLDLFRPYLRFISPVIRKDVVLVGLHSEDATTHFLLLGEIRWIGKPQVIVEGGEE